MQLIQLNQKSSRCYNFVFSKHA